MTGEHVQLMLTGLHGRVGQIPRQLLVRDPLEHCLDHLLVGVKQRHAIDQNQPGPARDRTAIVRRNQSPPARIGCGIIASDASRCEDPQPSKGSQFPTDSWSDSVPLHGGDGLPADQQERQNPATSRTVARSHLIVSATE